MATILGTCQSTLVNFRYLSKAWSHNTEEERLLGVSFTGIMDNPILYDMREYQDRPMLKDVLEELKNEAVETNAEWARAFNINPSTAITCVKPSGTVSQLVNSSSGIHPRYSEYYVRTVRADKKDPLATYMVEQGFPVEDDVTKPDYNYVFSFPVKSPATSVMRNDMTAIEQLELWKIYQEYWCEHKPSITVYVRDNEWLAVGAWCYDRFDSLSGVSFLPHSDHSYRQAPYQEIDKSAYEALCASMPQDIDWEQFSEDSDQTVGSQELACTAGACEI